METRTRIVEAYTNQLREHGAPPLTVHAFCKSLNIAESDFFQEFASLESVESAIWGAWICGLTARLESGAEWKEFSARHRYLTFLFAFTESSLDWRSLMLTRFNPLSPVASPPFLKAFEEHSKPSLLTLFLTEYRQVRSRTGGNCKLSTLPFYTSTSGLLFPFCCEMKASASSARTLSSKRRSRLRLMLFVPKRSILRSILPVFSPPRLGGKCLEHTG